MPHGFLPTAQTFGDHGVHPACTEFEYYSKHQWSLVPSRALHGIGRPAGAAGRCCPFQA
jgi:hypothetical protein